ncbi:MAG: ankyrin repeat domain-containing protein [Candidatus Thiodiazotropha sp.]|jgi:ankyrin repeat protein
MKYTLVSSLFIISCLFTLSGCNSMQAIHTSALDGDIGSVQDLVNKGADVEQKNSASGEYEGFTPLMMAINNGHEEVVRYLLDSGADVNASGKLGRTPLHLAAFNGMLELAQTLISQGANVNAKTVEGATPMHSAAIAIKNNVQVLQLLLANGADVNGGRDSEVGTPLVLSARYGDVEVAEILISNGADINAKNASGESALHISSQFGRLALANFLLRNNCDVNALDGDSNSSLHIAAMNGRRMIAEELVYHGANMLGENNFGDTPLDCARAHSKDSVVALLETFVKPKNEEQVVDEPGVLAN